MAVGTWYQTVTDNDRAAWDAISTVLREYCAPKIEAQFNYHCPVLEYMVQKSRSSGGHELTVPVEYDDSHSLGTPAFTDAWPQTHQDIHQRAKWEWKFAGGQLVLLREEIEWMTGAEQVFDLVAAKTRHLVSNIRKMMSWHLMWAGGTDASTTFTSPDDSSASWGSDHRAIDGLLALYGGSWSSGTLTEPTTGTTYGGVSAGDYSWWDAYRSTTSYAMTPATLMKLKMKVNRYGHPDIYVTSDAAWEAFWDSQEVRLKYDQQGFKPLVDAGFFDAFEFQGAPFVYSDWEWGSTNDGQAATSSYLRAINTNYAWLQFLGGQKNIKLDPFLESPGYGYRYSKARVTWNMLCSKRRAHGLMRDISDYV